MRAFERDGDQFVAELEEVEVALLASLVEQLCGLLGDDGDAPQDDPFARWAGEMRGGNELDLDDPVVRRLFPDAYADDRGASEEFRRFTADEQRRERIADARWVLAGLDATQEGRRDLTVPAERVEAWLRTINALRLSLAVRLGIESEADHDELDDLAPKDPRAYVLSIYDWLGFFLESLLGSLYDTM